MSPSAAPGAGPRRILVIANETCASPAIVDEVRYRGGDEAVVHVVAPALARSRLEHWLTSDLDRRQREARERLHASVDAMRAAGLTADGTLGDQDPLQALDDAMRVVDPHEVVIATHPPARSNWLERRVVQRARSRYPVPVTHVVVDLEHERAESDGRPLARPKERSRRMRVFHMSDYDEAMAIRDAGFTDHLGARDDAPGVWVTDRPPDGAAAGDAIVFAVDVPEEAVASFEREPDGEARRFLLPAELLNRHGPPVAQDDWSE